MAVCKSMVPLGRGGNSDEAHGLCGAIAPNHSDLFLKFLEELARHGSTREEKKCSAVEVYTAQSNGMYRSFLGVALLNLQPVYSGC